MYGVCLYTQHLTKVLDEVGMQCGAEEELGGTVRGRLGQRGGILVGGVGRVKQAVST